MREDYSEGKFDELSHIVALLPSPEPVVRATNVEGAPGRFQPHPKPFPAQLVVAPGTLRPAGICQ